MAAMEQLTFVEAGKIEVREAPAPRIESAGQAIVKPLAVSRCDLDFVFARGKAPVAGPFALGHECVAEVVEVGDGVRGAKPGDRVIVPFQISCGACPACLRGHTGNCGAVPKLAAYGLGPLSGTEYGGAVSDALLVPYADAMLVGLPAGTDPVVAAALGDNAIDGFRTVAQPLAETPGARVFVVGGGAPSVGLYAVAAAKALGASEVVYVDAGEDRCNIARRLGATVVQQKIDESLRLGRFPITVDASGRAEGLRLCIGSTEMEGTCTSVGIYFADVPLPLFNMYTRGIRFVTGRIHARRDLPAALELAAKGAFDLGTVATTRVAWADAAAAWSEPAAKLVLHR
jgi:threonine dehydrogenase-like Zn-dependent dehydrogenase